MVGRTLGWQHIKSTSFELRRTRDGFLFSGHGYGHGVGLCVTGAARLAEHGRSAEAILARYFPGLKISRPQSRARHPSRSPANATVVCVDRCLGRRKPHQIDHDLFGPTLREGRAEFGRSVADDDDVGARDELGRAAAEQ